MWRAGWASSPQTPRRGLARGPSARPAPPALPLPALAPPVEEASVSWVLVYGTARLPDPGAVVAAGAAAPNPPPNPDGAPNPPAAGVAPKPPPPPNADGVADPKAGAGAAPKAGVDAAPPNEKPVLAAGATAACAPKPPPPKAGVAAAGPADLAMLKLHPLQGVVDRALLVSRLERALVSVVSEVGVDVNAAVRYEHLAAALAYVPGLGVRKAQGLRQQLQALRSAKGRRKNDDADDADAESGGNAKNLPPLPRGLPNRQTLIDYKILGPQVYMNAAPFLRIPVAQFMSRCVPCRFSVVTEGSSDAVGPVVG